MDGVVILEPLAEAQEDRNGIRAGVHGGVVALGDGKLALADGVFMQAISAALKDSISKHVIVIEEINRGNPAQIFGELLTLLEAGRHTMRLGLERQIAAV